MKKLAILGSTGSIGRSTLSLVDLYPGQFQVASLAANSSSDLLLQQALTYRPRLVALADPEAAAELSGRLPGIRVAAGPEGVIEAAVCPQADTVVAAITGAAGLLPTYHALLEGKRVALANKETLVMAGKLIVDLVKKRRLSLLPVDSEHNALHQCLNGSTAGAVHRLILTASGGPFFRKSMKELGQVSVQEALNHPTWRMGPKITIDSATLMNKGLEVIEAHHLFSMQPEQISVVIHPQSTIHSMVEFVDGTVIAQMSITDMRSCLLYALSYPERWQSRLPRIDLHALPALEFFPPEPKKFPCLRLAYQSLQQGATYPVALNAANEVAVSAFLQGRISFTSIPEVIEEVLNKHQPGNVKEIDCILSADRESRALAETSLKPMTMG